MTTYKIKKIALSTFFAASVATTAHAVDAPDAETLTNRMYGGLHGVLINPDNERELSEITPGILPIEYTFIDNSLGFGAEIGYRFMPKFETRLSFSFLDLKAKENGFKDANGSLAAIDLLYFPTGKNFYALGGFDRMDIEDKEWSLDLGAGYRHYLSENTALYAEGKGHYQFDNEFIDYSARIGFIYFFGDTGKALPTSKPAPAAPAKKAVAAPVVVKAIDSDNDGVLDADDKCADTPATHKVDANGCTVYFEDEVSIELSVGFATNSSEVSSDYFSEIEKAATFLNTYPETSLVIEGHTSILGNAKYNKKLSQKRADAVMQVLVSEYNVDASRLSAIGFGEENLLDDANTKAAHAKNRRIEAKATLSKKMPVIK